MSKKKAKAIHLKSLRFQANTVNRMLRNAKNHKANRIATEQAYTQTIDQLLQTELSAKCHAFQIALDLGLCAGDFRNAKLLLQHAGDGLPKNLSPSLEESLFRLTENGSNALAYCERISSGSHLRTLPFRDVVVDGKKGKLFDTRPNPRTGELWCVVAFPDGTVDHNVKVKTLDELVGA